MKKARVLLVATLCLSLITALFGLAACGEGGGGVAATVNGTEIMEADVTERIEAVRAQDESYADDTAWAKALAGSQLTPESLRESNINAMAREIIISQEAEAQGYTVDEEAITTQIEQTKTTVGGDDESWLETLKQYGFKDEQAYRDMLVTYDLQTQLYDAYQVEPTDEELVTFVAENPGAVTGYVYGVGEVEVPADDATAEVTEEEGAEALEELPAEGTASTAEPVDPSTVDLSTIPADILTQFKEQWNTNNKGAKFNEWVEELVASADIVINEMPADVSYNVDMSLAETGDEGTGTDADTGTGTETPSSFSSEEAIQSALAEGLEITEDVIGEGEEAHDGDTVVVRYIGTLEDGTEFDSNQDDGITVTLGTGSVIKGWDAGLVGMKVGGKRTLTIPPSLAYGDAERDGIPAGSTLFFEVELMDVTHGHE